MITNKFNLPPQIMRALSNPAYSKGDADFSVTQLIGPAYIRHLRKTVEPEVDATQLMKAFIGTAVHAQLDSLGAHESAISEGRLNILVDGYVISGQIDNIEDHRIEDTKTTSVWSFKLGGKKEWEQQLNIYAQLCRSVYRDTGDDRYRIESLRAHLVFTDFKESVAGIDGNPRAIVEVVDFPLWPEEQAMAFIRERIAAHTNENPEVCTDEEKWAKPAKWALMKVGRKSAIKLFDNASDAGKAVVEKTMFVEVRPGSFTRCEKFCDVSHSCPEFQKAKIF